MENDDDNADVCDETFESVKEEAILESSVDSVEAEHVTFERGDDRNGLLRQFDELQSIKCDKTDIVAQAMELSSIPTDMNNNSDIVSQAMQMSNISSDIVMDF